MFINYLKIALRNIKRYKGYSIINISGLAIGMAACIFILLWVQDEISYDRFHKNSDQIFRVVHYSDYAGNELHVALTPGPLSQAMKQELPEVIKATSFDFAGGMLSYKEKSFNYVEAACVEPDFFDIFSFPLIQGDAELAVSDQNSIIITRQLAARIFGDEDPLGKVLTFNKKYDYKVTGIMENIPRHSHLQFECIIPFKKLADFGRSVNEWKPNAFYTYIMLRKGVSENKFNEKIKNFKRIHYADCRDYLYVQPLTKIHLYSNFSYAISGHGDIKYVIIFSLVAGFILLIACINFMNLTTALSGTRAKEVGLRKVVGATRKTLISQFLGESVFMAFLALIIAILLVSSLLPYYNELTAKELSLFSQGIFSLSSLLIIILAIGVIAGSYPAFMLSSFQPIKVLKGVLPANLKSLHLRKILVVIQFGLSIFLMISNLVISSQLKYIQSKKLGFEKEHLFYATIPFEYETIYNALKNELLKWADITHVTRMQNFPTSDHVNSYSNLSWEGKNPDDRYLFCIHDADYDMFETFGMTMSEGRSFSRLFPTDTSAYVLNEKAVDIMGIRNPIGKMFSQGGRTGKIIGVVKNFHFKSLKNEIEPLVFRLPINHARRIFIKISSNDILRTMGHIETTWKNFVPGSQAEFGFLEDAYDMLYRSEKRMGKLVGYFASLAIFISCLGLFGLASFMIERRTKEIGIRKVLGASVPGIVRFLSNEFIILVAISNVIAWPLAYCGAKKWLQNFAYHIDLSWLYFVIAGLLALLIVVVVVSFQSLKVAVTNPVESLRYE
jgi:putative ABC transport system permease protein